MKPHPHLRTSNSVRSRRESVSLLREWRASWVVESGRERARGEGGHHEVSQEKDKADAAVFYSGLFGSIVTSNVSVSWGHDAVMRAGKGSKEGS